MEAERTDGGAEEVGGGEGWNSHPGATRGVGVAGDGGSQHPATRCLPKVIFAEAGIGDSGETLKPRKT